MGCKEISSNPKRKQMPHQPVKDNNEKKEKLDYKIFRQEIKSDKAGVITNIKALNIGKLSCSLGAGRINKEDTIDYGVGIILNKQVGDVINIGDTLFTLYKKNSNNITLNISEYYEIN